MLFNSIDFLIFLPIIYILYWFVVNKSLTLQNIIVLIASYVFYGWWDWRFLGLLLLSTIIDYSFGLLINNHTSKKKLILWTSIFNNLIILGFFKYYNFFAESFAVMLAKLGLHVEPYILNIALPVGISFYTFHGMSYVFDIYNEKIKPEKDFVKYACFVSFFPLLVAGPIERASHLLPQFSIHKKFDYSKSADGLRQILWGLFKKIVIADNCAPLVNDIFSNPDYSSSTLVIGAVLFSFQIYCDFSGYSDMALGIARLFGFELIQNFSFPYFSRDIAEFWRRWHISLSSWFRDYVYIPLGGSKVNNTLKIRNTFIIFTLSGFWHGANWTFIVWGILNAVFFIPLLLSKRNRANMEIVAFNKKLPSLKEFISIVATFLLTTLAWVFFRAENVSSAFIYIKNIFSKSILTLPNMGILFDSFTLFIFIGILILFEWVKRDKKHGLEDIFSSRLLARWSVYVLLFLIILTQGAWTENQDFIYFQF